MSTATQQPQEEQTSLSIPQCIFCRGRLHVQIFSTPHFVVMYDESPLIEGHLMIHSKAHFGCAGELPKKILKELIQIKNRVASLLRKIYGTVSFYEHGRAGHCVSFHPDERLCHHFHIHALPFKGNISDSLKPRFKIHHLKKYKEIKNMFDRFGEYLYFESNLQDLSFFPVNIEIESHLLRTLISQAIKHPERANWETFSDSSLIEKAKKKISPQLNKHFSLNLTWRCHG